MLSLSARNLLSRNSMDTQTSLIEEDSIGQEGVLSGDSKLKQECDIATRDEIDQIEDSIEAYHEEFKDDALENSVLSVEGELKLEADFQRFQNLKTLVDDHLVRSNIIRATSPSRLEREKRNPATTTSPGTPPLPEEMHATSLVIENDNNNKLERSFFTDDPSPIIFPLTSEMRPFLLDLSKIANESKAFSFPKDLPAYEYKLVKMLILRGNSLDSKALKTIPLQRLTELHSLDLGSNCLTSIGVESVKLHKLLLLDLSYNRLRGIPDLTSCELLEEMNLSHNCISYLDPMPPSLSWLDISDNNLATQMSYRMLSLNTKLVFLDFSHNPVASKAGTVYSLRSLLPQLHETKETTKSKTGFIQLVKVKSINNTERKQSPVQKKTNKKLLSAANRGNQRTLVSSRSNSQNSRRKSGDNERIKTKAEDQLKADHNRAIRNMDKEKLLEKRRKEIEEQQQKELAVYKPRLTDADRQKLAKRLYEEATTKKRSQHEEKNDKRLPSTPTRISSANNSRSSTPVRHSRSLSPSSGKGRNVDRSFNYQPRDFSHLLPVLIGSPNSSHFAQKLNSSSSAVSLV